MRAASQSKDERTERALKGDLMELGVALRGESSVEVAGEGGMCRLGKEATPVGGADRGYKGYGLAGVPAVVGDLLVPWFPHLHEQSVCSLLAVDGIESGAAASSSSSSSLELPGRFSGTTGEATEMDLRKSM